MRARRRRRLKNDLDEFYNLIDFCCPKSLGSDRKAFERAFGKPILRARDKDATERELLAGQRASAEFYKKVHTIMLRRTNEVIAKYLPAKLDACVFITLTTEQQQLHTDVVDEGKRTYEELQTHGSTFQTVTMLKKICNDPAAALPARCQLTTPRPSWRSRR